MTTHRHGVTEQDARALAYLARRLRQDTHGANDWDEPGIMAELRPRLGHNLAVTAELVIRHAADPEAKTPGAIRRPFVPEAAGPERPRPPKYDPHNICGECSKTRADCERTEAAMPADLRHAFTPDHRKGRVPGKQADR